MERRDDMAKEKNPQEKQPEQPAPEATAQTGNQAAPAQGRVRLNFEGVVPQYANFCTFAVRGGEVFLSFGKAFVPTEELKIDTQVVMSIRNLQQMHQAIGRLLQQVAQQERGVGTGEQL
jgi:hypothetical protein